MQTSRAPAPLHPPKRRPPARSLALPPPAQRPTTSGARPFLRPPRPHRPEPPRRSPSPAALSPRPARSGPRPRALNPLAAAGDARGGARRGVGAVPAADNFLARLRTPLPSPVLRICSFQLRGSWTPCLPGQEVGPGFLSPRLPLLPPREGKGRKATERWAAPPGFFRQCEL